MYPATQKFKDIMRASCRRVIGRVTIDYTSPFIDQSINVSVSEKASTSYPGQTADGISEPFAKYAAFDGTWAFGQGFSLAPNIQQAKKYQMGWWGKQLAGASGSFTAPYPTLTVAHFGRPIHRLRLSGDSKRTEWPVSFTINLYGENDAVLHTENINDNDQIHWSKELDDYVTGVVKQELIIKKWSHQGRQVKIVEFFASIRQTYESDDLVGINLLEERETGSDTIPVGAITSNEINIKLRNDDRRFDDENELSPLYQLLKPNRRIHAWLGVRHDDETEEMIPLGVYWSTEWQAPENEVIATVTARDRMELLRKSTYQSSQVAENKNLAELAEMVLLDAGLASGEYVIDPGLENINVPYAWFDPITHREALRQIAEAGVATAYVDRDGRIRIEPLSLSTQTEGYGTFFLQGAAFPAGDVKYTKGLGISAADYFQRDTPQKYGDVANEVIIETQPLRPVDDEEIVYKSNDPILIPAGQTIAVTINYNIKPVISPQISLADAADTSVVIQNYGWGAEITLCNQGAQAEHVTLTISGKPLKVLNQDRVVARDEDSIVDLGVLRYELRNPLVQTRDAAQQLADAILSTVADPRRDVEIDWRGNPALELGDPIIVAKNAYMVIRQELSWAGALGAKLNGRKA